MSEHLDWLLDADPARPRDIAGALSEAERREFAYHWKLFARPQQLAPPGDWRIWLVMAGRGFGKTRTGAEWVRQIAEENSKARIALVASSLAEARAVMVEGESGLLACCPPGRRPIFEPALRRLRFPNGAQAQLFSAAEPEAMRGPQHSHAWCDEIGKWPLAANRAVRVWDNLLMGLRLGNKPQILATTTPRAVPLVTRLMALKSGGEMVLTTGATHDNAGNLPQRFLAAVETEFGNSELARQEIGGELLSERRGALWSRKLIETAREEGPPVPHRRVVVAVDPPISDKGDACGIVVAALGEDGIARVLADCTRENCLPDAWARAVSVAAREWEADRIVAEANQGGAMVESVLRAADRAMPITLVHASRGKVARAEPVAALYAAGRARHCGTFAQLEDQMCGLMIGGEYHGPGRSPDRADALVWAMTQLMLAPARAPLVHTF